MIITRSSWLSSGTLPPPPSSRASRSVLPLDARLPPVKVRPVMAPGGTVEHGRKEIRRDQRQRVAAVGDDAVGGREEEVDQPRVDRRGAQRRRRGGAAVQRGQAGVRASTVWPVVRSADREAVVEPGLDADEEHIDRGRRACDQIPLRTELAGDLADDVVVDGRRTDGCSVRGRGSERETRCRHPRHQKLLHGLLSFLVWIAPGRPNTLKSQVRVKTVPAEGHAIFQGLGRDVPQQGGGSVKFSDSVAPPRRGTARRAARSRPARLAAPWHDALACGLMRPDSGETPRAGEETARACRTVDASIS